MTPPHHWWHQWPEWTNLRTQLNNPAQSKAKVHYKALVRWTKAPFQQNHATHFKFLPCNFTTFCIRVPHNITLCIVIEVSNPSEQHFKTFLGPCLTTRTRQQCRLNWPTLVLAVLQLFREEFGWIRKMPRIQNKQKSAKGWELVPVTNLGYSTIHGLGSPDSLGSQHHQYHLGSRNELGSHCFKEEVWSNGSPGHFWSPADIDGVGSPGSPGAQNHEMY